MKNEDIDEINALRLENDLPPIEPATVKCLRCDQPFESWDKRNNRICDECKNDDSYGNQCETYKLPQRMLKRLPNSKAWLDRRVSYLDVHYGDGYYDDPIEESLLDTTLMDREDL